MNQVFVLAFLEPQEVTNHKRSLLNIYIHVQVISWKCADYQVTILTFLGKII
jgi:hypothetical protein